MYHRFTTRANMTHHASFTAFRTAADKARLDDPSLLLSNQQLHRPSKRLVNNLHVYGWTTEVFLELFGPRWLDQGWVNLTFKKPTYHGNQMEVIISKRAGGEFKVLNQDKDVCLKGHVGLGSAPWLSNIKQTRLTKSLPQPETRTALSLANAPLKRSLIPMSVTLSKTDSEAFITHTQGHLLPVYQGEQGRCHPIWLASRLTDLLQYSYSYGPAIHTHSHIQQLAPAYAGQTFTVTGYCHDAYERNGHHYIENDGSIWAENGSEVTRLRHTAIFKLKDPESL